MNFPITPTDLTLLSPEILWLEPQHFEQATPLSHPFPTEAQQWQAYLTALALLSFSQWLNDRLPEQPIAFEADSWFQTQSALLTVGKFRLGLIATEHVLNEVIAIPEAAIDDITPDFFIALEVCEEQEQVLFRGALRADHLRQYLNQNSIHSCHWDGATANFYPLPLSLFDAEPNHFITYCRFMQPQAIAPTLQVAAQSVITVAAQPRIKLSEWLQEQFVEGWQAIENMIHPEASLAFNTRTPGTGATRGRLIDIEAQLGHQTLALLVNITREADDKFGVLVQLHPTNGRRYLPPNVKLSLLSRTGNLLQEVQARSQDNYIQLRSFRGGEGTGFSLEVCLLDIKLKEDFEL